MVSIDGLVNKHIDATGRGRWCDQGEQPIQKNPPTPEYEEYEEHLETQEEGSPICNIVWTGTHYVMPPVGIHCPSGCKGKKFDYATTERAWECGECGALADIVTIK